METSAIISPCGLYRYELRRPVPGGDPTSTVLLYIQHNPSTADAKTNDATIRRNIGFARRLGYGGIVVGNLFAFRATDPGELLRCADPIGPENLKHLRILVGGANRIVCAWGNLHPRLSPVAHGIVNELGLRHDARAWCFGRTKSGEPRHPVRLPYSVNLVPFGDGQ